MKNCDLVVLNIAYFESGANFYFLKRHLLSTLGIWTKYGNPDVKINCLKYFLLSTTKFKVFTEIL